MNGDRAFSLRVRFLSMRFLLTALLALAFAGAAGVILGYHASRNAWGHKLRAALGVSGSSADSPLPSTPEPEPPVPAPSVAKPPVEWKAVDTHSLSLESARFQIRFPDGTRPAAMEEIGDTLIVVSRHGSFSLITPDHSIRDIDLSVPMNIDVLREQPEKGVLDFPGPMFRTLDMLSVITAPGSYSLYVSYERWKGNCLEFAVSRLNLTLVGDIPEPRDEWRDVWTAKPCLSPDLFPDPQYFWNEALWESGGRLALKDGKTILVSTGDFDMDGRTHNGFSIPDAPQDPGWDFGKIIAVDLNTGASRQLASGIRNPQGLLVDRSQRIWETEHGPQGGDELNLIRTGANYGWPRVTYGTQYSYREKDPDATYFDHKGYVAPVEAFVPSVGISQLIQPSRARYPQWQGSLLAGALSGRAIYVLRLQGEDVVYVETIPVGIRVRDMMERRNGDIAITGDGGTILFLRPSGEVPNEALKIVDLRTPRESPKYEERKAERSGAESFLYKCSPCHTLNGRAGIGPALNGVVNREIAADEGYDYSSALRRAEGRWTPQRLHSFLEDPGAAVPGTIMLSPGVTPEQVDDILAYLSMTQ